MRGETNIPTIFVAFGATGDLMRLKVIPALFNLYQKGELPELFTILGFGRRAWSDADYRGYVKGILEEYGTGRTPQETVDRFLRILHFQEGVFEDDASYTTLKQRVEVLDAEWGVCANKLFYLAVAPEYFETILRKLDASHLTEPCSAEEGWTRIIVEKPFGTDDATARTLDGLLGELFEEKQLYRIDHYLAKEMLQNILTFRFANNLFEGQWGSELIESIHIRLLERVGVEKRGPYYDKNGALRDVGQNHFLQMLALLTMERPETFDMDAVRGKRAEILQRLALHSDTDVREKTFRAQYDGYRSITGVAPESQTETYFKVVATLEDSRWEGVPIILEGGKRLGDPLKETVITFKHASPCLCPPEGHHQNKIVIRLEPQEEIMIEFWSKKPGLSMQTEQRWLHFLLREPTARMQYTEEYERLLLDCIRGDQTLFITTEEIRAMWRFVDPILAGWEKGLVPVHFYAPDTKDITGKAPF